MKKRRLWALLGLFVAVGAAFLLLSFRLAVSDTRSEKSIGTTGMGNQMPDAMRRRDKITIAVVGEGPWARAIKRALTSEMDQAELGDVQEALDLQQSYQNPVVLVKMDKRSLFWTPFFATSTFEIHVGFASSGDTGLLGDTPITVDNRNGPVLVMSGEYKFADRSWGLMSRPGYHHFLAEYVARQIVASLKDLYAAP